MWTFPPLPPYSLQFLEKFVEIAVPSLLLLAVYFFYKKERAVNNR